MPASYSRSSPRRKLVVKPHPRLLPGRDCAARVLSRPFKLGRLLPEGLVSECAYLRLLTESSGSTVRVCLVKPSKSERSHPQLFGVRWWKLLAAEAGGHFRWVLTLLLSPAFHGKKNENKVPVFTEGVGFHSLCPDFSGCCLRVWLLIPLAGAWHLLVSLGLP